MDADGTDYEDLAAGAATVEVTDDDDTPTATLTLAPARIDESGASNVTTVTASLSNPSGAAVTFTVSAAAVAPAKNVDFTLSTNKTLSIAKGATASTGAVTITASGGGVANPANVTLTITDNDGRGVTVTPTALPALAEVDDAGTDDATENQGVYEVVLTSRPTGTVTVNVASSNTSIATVSASSLTFAPGVWNTAQEVTVTAVPDNYDNTADKRNTTITHTVSAIGTDYASETASSVTVEVTDDDAAPVIALSAAPASVAESASATSITVTATLSGTTRLPASRDVRVTVGDADDDATSGTDYAPVTAFDVTLAKDAASGSASFSLNPTQDTIDEGAGEALTVSGVLTGVTVSDTSVTITDDDATPGGITLSVSPTTVAEDKGAAETFTVMASVTGGTEFGEDKTVAIAVGGGTATAGTDYGTVSGFSITIPAGEMSADGDFDLTPTNDALDEDNETVNVTGTLSGVTLTNTSLTITDDDDPPVISISSPSVTEGDSADETAATLTFTVSLDAASAKTVTVTYADTTTSTAASGTDYTAITGATLSFAPGETEKTVAVTVTGDDIDEDNETVILRLSSPTNATLAGGVTTLNGTGTITDDDTATLSIGDATAAEGASATFTIRLSTARSTATTVTATTSTEATDTATAPADYTHKTQALSIAAGSTSTTFTVALIDDSLNELAETFTVTLSDASVTISDTTATGTIIGSGDTLISIANASAVEGSNLSFAVTRSGDTTGASSFTWTTGDDTADGANKATADIDYTAVDTAQTVTFAANETTKSITVTSTADDLIEGSETFRVNLTSPTGTVLASNFATGTITEGTTGYKINDANADEGETITFTITREGLTTATGSVKWNTTADTTADANQATATDDYTPVTTARTVSFLAGETAKDITVDTDEDTADEPDETFRVVLSQPTAGILTDAFAIGTINDDDAPTLSIANASANEGDNMTFTVSLTSAHDADVEVTATTSTGSDDTATATDDYTAKAQDLTIAQGATSASFTVTTLEDAIDEANETFTVTLSGASPAAVTIADATATGTITDDDERGVTISETTVTVRESDDGDTTSIREDQATYTVVLDSEPTGGTVTIELASEDEDIATVTPASIPFTATTWDTAVTVTVTGVNDDTDNAANKRTTAITHTVDAEDTDYEDETAGDVDVEVTDDDGTPGATLTLSPARIDESGASNETTVTASLSNPSGSAVTLTVSAAAVSPAANSAFTLSNNTTLTIAKGATTSTGEVTITAVDNAVDTTDATVNVSATASGGGVANPANATLTITDDDTRGVTVTPTALPALAEVDDAGTDDATENEGVYEVVLTSRPTGTVRVNVASSNTSIATVSASTLTFAPADWNVAQEVTVTAVPDNYDNTGDKRNTTITNTVSATGTDYASETASSVTVEVTDDDAAPAIALSAAPASVAESASATAVTVTATLSGTTRLPTEQKVRVTVGKTADSATSATDYEAVAAFDVTIAKDAASGSADFTLTPTDDEVYEDDESISISGSLGALTVTDATLTLAENDEAPEGITLSLTPTSVAEDAGKAVTVTVTAEVGGDVAFDEDKTVAVSVGGGSATVTDDYAAVSGFNITIAAGALSQTGSFDITPADDAIDEDNETVNVTGTVTGVTVTNTSLTITDDDVPVLSIAAAAAKVDAGTAASFTVTSDIGPAAALDVAVTVSETGNFAADGATGSKTFTYAKGATSQTYSVATVSTRADQADAAVTVALATGTGYTPSASNGSATVEVTDGAATTITLARAGSGGVAENGGTLNITVTLGRTLAAGETVTVPLSVSGATVTTHYTLGLKGAGGTGVSLSTSAPHSAQHPAVVLSGAGARTATLLLTAKPNADHLTRTLAIAYGTSTRAPAVIGSGGGTTLAGSPLSVPIIDDDAMITVGAASVAEGGNLDFTVTLPDPAPTGGVTIDYATGDGRGNDTDAAYQVAVASQDYTAAAANAQLTIAAGDSSGTIRVATLQDSTYESDHYLTVTLETTSHFNISATAGAAVGAITDALDTPSFQFSATTSTVDEDDDATLTVSRTGTTLVPAVLAYATADGTAKAGSDYTAVAAGSLTIAAGDSSDTLDIEVTDDSADELTESFRVDLSATSHATLGTNTSHTVSITDDDPTSVTLSAPAGNIDEGDSKVITLTLGRALVQGETLSAPLTFGGDATFGADYTLTEPDTTPRGVRYTNLGSTSLADRSPTVAFSGGTNVSSTATLTLEARDDLLYEGAETVTLGLATLDENSGTGLDGGATNAGTASFSIDDDDAAPTRITLSLDTTTVAENVAAAPTVTVTATIVGASSYPEDKDVEITVGATSDSATSGTDYTAIPAFDVTIAAGEVSGEGTFKLTPDNDDIDEGASESISVSGALTGVTVTGASITLTDNDNRGVSVSPTTLTLEEVDDSATNTVTENVKSYDVVLTSEPTGAVEINLSNNASTVATANKTRLTFPPGDWGTAQTVTVTAVSDSYDNAGNKRTATITHAVSAAGTDYASVTADPVEVTVNDDDGPASNIRLTVDTATVAEDAGATTVRVTAAIVGNSRFPEARTVAITVGKSTDTARSGADYTPVTGFDITIPKDTASASETFTLTPTDDKTDEVNEALTLTGALTGITVGEATVTITDNDAAPGGIVLSVSPTSVAENAAGSTSITVKASTSAGTAYEQARTIIVSVGDDDDTATSGTDYAAVTDITITLPADAVSATGSFGLDPEADYLDEGNEAITVSGQSTGVTVTGTTLTITDVTVAKVLVSLTRTGAAAIDEGTSGEPADGGKIAFTVSLSRALIAGERVDVPLRISGRGVTTADFADGLVTAGANTGVTLESATSLTPTVIFRGAGAQTATLELEAIDGDHETPRNEVVRIDLGTDAQLDADSDTSVSEDLVLRDPASNTFTVTVSDDEYLFTFDNNVHTVNENAGTVSLPLTLSRALNRDIQVRFKYLDSSTSSDPGDPAIQGNPGNTTVDQDYEPAFSFPDFATIKAGATAYTLTFKLLDDQRIEGVERLRVAAAPPQLPAGITRSKADVYIQDNDTGATPVSLSASGASLTEGGNLTLTATLGTAPSGAAVTIPVERVAAGSDAVAADFRLSGAPAGSITVAAGQKSGSITLTAVDDSADEPRELLRLGFGTLPANYAESASHQDPRITLIDNDASTVTLSVPDARAEEGNREDLAEITLTLNRGMAPHERLDVPLVFSGGALGTDFTLVLSGHQGVSIASGTVRFAGDPGSEPDAIVPRAPSVSAAAATLTLLALEDADRTDDTVAVSIPASTSGSGAVLRASNLDGGVTGSVTRGHGDIDLIDNDPQALVLSKSRLTVTEGGAGTYTVALETQPTGPVTVSIESDNAEITVDTDAVAGGAQTSLVFSTTDWDEARTVTVRGGEDDDAGNDTAKLTHSATGADYGGVTGEVAVTVNDPDTPALVFTPPASLAVNEGASASYTVALATRPTAAVTVSIESDNTEVTVDTDSGAQGSQATLTFPVADWNTAQTVAVTAADDNDSVNDTASLTHTAAGGDYATVTGNLAVAVADADAPPTGIDLSVSLASIAENAAATDITVTATVVGASVYADAKTVAVTVGGDDDTATEGTDYDTVGALSITVPANQRSATVKFTLTPTDDDLDEGASESISVTGESGDLAITGASITLTDNETKGVSVDPLTLTLEEVDDGSTTTVTEHQGTYTVVLTSEPTANVEITIASGAAGTATVNPARLTFAPGDWDDEQRVTVTAVADAYDNAGDERTATITHTLAAGASDYGGVTAASVEVTVTDDDDAPTNATLSVSPASVSEGADATTVRVTAALVGDSRFAEARTVAVSVGKATDTAVEDTDYAEVGAVNVTIPIGAASGSSTFSLAPIDDSIDEDNESLSVEGVLTGVTVAATSVTITDDDDAPTGIGLSVSPTSVAENASAPVSVIVTASVKGDTEYDDDKTVAVTVGKATDGAASGTDYAPVTGFNITIPAGEMSATGSFSLNPTNDALDEDNETLSVNGATSGITVGGATVTITDDDALPVLSIDSPTVTEGDSSAATLTFAVSLDAASGRVVTVDYADILTGTAASGTDYTAITAGTLTFAAGTTSRTVAVSVTGDTSDEPNETVALRLSAPTNATLSGGKATLDGTGTINDNDDPPTVSVADASAVMEGNDSSRTTNMTFALTLSAASGKTVTVPYTLGGNASAPDDYTAPDPLSVTIAPGSATASIVVPIKGDEIDEENETIVVTLSTPTNATVSTVQGAGTATGTITDDEGTPTVTLALSPTAIGESGTANRSTVTASLSSVSSDAVTLMVSAAPVTPAVAGDFALSADKTLTIAAGSRSSTGVVTVTAVDNDVDAANRTVTVSATVMGGHGVAAPADVSLTIRDDDKRDLVISEKSLTVVEADDALTTNTVENQATYTVKLASEPTGGSVTVSLTSGAASVAGVSSASETFTASNWNDARMVTVTGVNDDVDNDGNKRTTHIRHSVSATGTDYESLPHVDLPVTVSDDDGPPTGIALSLSHPTLSENAATTTVTVTATVSGGSTYPDAKAVTVRVGASGDTATEGADYGTVADITITVPANARSATGSFSLAPTDDIIDDDDESISVAGSVAGDTVTVTGDSITLTDNDDAPTGIELAVSPASVSEATTSQRVTVTASVTGGTAYAERKTVTVSVGQSDDSATEGTDYTNVGDLTIRIGAGATSATGNFTLRPANDTLDEDNESIGVEGSSGNLTVTGTTLSLTDNDDPPTLSAADVSVAEGNSGSKTLRFTVRLNRASSKQVTVAYADAGDGSADAGSDYTAISAGTLTFAPGDTSKSVDVTVTGDAIDEGESETVVLRLSSPVNAGLAGGGATLDATGTITDDDKARVEISEDELQMLPTETRTYDVRLNSQPESNVDVTATIDDSDVAVLSAGSTNNAAAVTLRFTPGNWQTAQTVTVSGVAEGEPSITHSLATSAASYRDVTADPVEVDIKDGPVLRLQGPRPRITPEGGTVLIGITADEEPERDIQVAVRVEDQHGALDPADRGLREVILPKGETQVDISITVPVDTVDQDQRGVSLTLEEGPGYRLVDPDTFVGRVSRFFVDDDRQPVKPDPGPFIAIEGGSGVTEGTAARFTLTARDEPDVDLSVGLVVAQTGAFVASGGLNRQTVTFPKGETTHAFDIATKADRDDEIDGDVTVTLASGTGYRVDEDADAATVPVADDDATGIRLSRRGSGAIGELNGTADVTVTLGRALREGEGATVPLTVTGASYDDHYLLDLVDAGAGVGMTTGRPHSWQNPAVTFAGGDKSARTATLRFTSRPNDDTESRTIGVAFGSGSRAPDSAGLSGGVATSGGAVSIPIVDDDAAVSIAAPVAREEGEELYFSVDLPEPSPAGGVIIEFETLDGRGVSGDASHQIAVAGSDYRRPTGQNARIQIPEGRTNGGVITIRTLDDDEYEGDHYFRVRLTSTSHFTIGSADTAVGTILDEGDRSSFGFAETALEVDEGAGSVTLTVERTGDAGAPASVKYATSDVEAASGSDYSSKKGELTFGAGVSSVSLKVPVVDDSLDEAPERFRVTLKGGGSGAAPQATVTIVDNDPTSVSLSFDTLQLSEGIGATEITLSLGRSLEDGEVLSVPLDFAGSAEIGEDYSVTAPDPWPPGVSYSNLAPAGGTGLPPPTVTFRGGAGNAREAPVIVTPIVDTSHEGDETVIVNIGDLGSNAMASPDGGASGDGSAHIRIRNVNPFLPHVSVSGPGAVTEGEDVTFTFTAEYPEDAPRDAPLEIDYSLVAGGGDTWDENSAVPGEGVYQNSIVLPAGADTVTLVVETMDDELPESDGALTAVITGDENYKLRDRSQWEASVTVRDNDEDGLPVVTIFAGADAREGGEAVFTLHIDPAPDADLDARVRVRSSPFWISESEWNRVVGAYTTVTIAAGATEAELRIELRDDDEYAEEDGTISAELIAVEDHYRVGDPSSATMALLDNGDRSELSVADARVNEGPGARLEFAVTLNPASPFREVTVDYATYEVTATAGSDYTAASGTLRFAPGETEKTVTVDVLDDAHDEGEETLELGFSNAEAAYLERSVATGTIVNSDPMPQAWLARFGRAVAEQVVEGVSGRWEETRSPGLTGRLAGTPFSRRESREDEDAENSETSSADRAAEGRGGEHDDAGLGYGAFGASACSGAGAGIGGYGGTVVGGSGIGRGRNGGDISAAGISASRGGGYIGAGTQSPGGGQYGASGGSTSMNGGCWNPGRYSGDVSRQDRRTVLRNLLLQSDFTLTRRLVEKDDEAGTYALWARASEARFDGAQAGASLDGEVATGMFGADFARGNWLVGLALTHSLGEGRYTPEQGGGGEVDAVFTALTPYAHLRLGDGLSMWGVAGAGQGALALKPQDKPALQSDLGWEMVAAGVRDEIIDVPVGGGIGLAVKSDLLWARTTSDAVLGLAGSTADVARFRAGVEGTWSLAFDRVGALTPKFESGVRYDAGDAEAGWGIELGGGLAWQYPARGIDFSVEGRGLLTHEDGAFRDVGYSASLAFDPRPASEQGLSFALRQEFGGRSSGGVESLFSTGAPMEIAAFGVTERRWTAEAAWGRPAFRERFMGLPFVSRSWSGTRSDTTLGWRLMPDGGLDLSLDMEVNRTESDGESPDHTIGIEIRVIW